MLNPDTVRRLELELNKAETELTRHLASYEYACIQREIAEGRLNNYLRQENQPTPLSDKSEGGQNNPTDSVHYIVMQGQYVQPFECITYSYDYKKE